MPVKYRVIPRLNLVYVNACDTVTADERIDAFLGYMVSSDARPGRSTIVDFSSCTCLDMDFADMNRLVSAVLAVIDPYDATMMTAMYAPRDDIYEQCLNYQQLVSGSERQMVAVFRTLSDSLRFLNLSQSDLRLEKV